MTLKSTISNPGEVISMKPVRISPGNQAFLPGMLGTITFKTQKWHLESSILHFFLLVVRSLATNAVHRWRSFSGYPSLMYVLYQIRTFGNPQIGASQLISPNTLNEWTSKTLDIIKEIQARTDASNMMESNIQVYFGICKRQVLLLWERHYYYTKHGYCDYQ